MEFFPEVGLSIYHLSNYRQQFGASNSWGQIRLWPNRHCFRDPKAHISRMKKFLQYKIWIYTKFKNRDIPFSSNYLIPIFEQIYLTQAKTPWWTLVHLWLEPNLKHDCSSQQERRALWLKLGCGTMFYKGIGKVACFPVNAMTLLVRSNFNRKLALWLTGVSNFLICSLR